MLYLIDKPMAEIGTRTAETSTDGTIVLIQDGVLLEPECDVPTVALERDVNSRGVSLPTHIDTITDAELVERMVDEEVKTFV